MAFRLRAAHRKSGLECALLGTSNVWLAIFGQRVSPFTPAILRVRTQKGIQAFLKYSTIRTYKDSPCSPKWTISTVFKGLSYGLLASWIHFRGRAIVSHGKKMSANVCWSPLP